MIRCDADVIECAKGWQAEFCPFSGMIITTAVYIDKAKLKEKTEQQAKKLNIIINWDNNETQK